MMDKSLFKLPGVHPVIAAILVFSLAEASLVVGQAHFLATVIVGVFDGGIVTAFRTPPLMGFLGCFIGLRIVIAVLDAIVDRFAVKASNRLQEQLLDIAFSDASATTARMGSASLTVSALEGVDQIETYLRVVMPKVFGVIAIPLPLLAVAFSQDWVSGVILFAMFPVIIMFMVVIGRNTAAKAAAQYETYHALSNRFIDTLRGIATLKAFGAGKRTSDDVYRSSEDFRAATMKTIASATMSSGVLDLIATLGVAAVAMMLGFRLLDGTMDLYRALLVLFLAPEYFKPIRAFASDYHASQDGKNALAALNGIIEEAAAAAPIGDATISAWGESSTLVLSGVGYTYPQSEHSALHDVEARFEGNVRVALVGASGSGKSTLAALLAGFASPDEGGMVLDGSPVGTLFQRAWRDQVLYIPQNPYVFHASLRSNIAFYTPEATDADIERAVDAVGLRAFVDELPEGLDTVVGQGGRGLSGGQAQRIAFARALLDGSRRVLVFDEPTAHLDIETELELKQRMLQLFEGRLVIFATHRLHWLDSVDQVLVVEDGTVVDSGSPAQLLGRSEALKRVADAQEGGEAA